MRRLVKGASAPQNGDEFYRGHRFSLGEHEVVVAYRPHSRDVSTPSIMLTVSNGRRQLGLRFDRTYGNMSVYPLPHQLDTPLDLKGEFDKLRRAATDPHATLPVQTILSVLGKIEHGTSHYLRDADLWCSPAAVSKTQRTLGEVKQVLMDARRGGAVGQSGDATIIPRP